MTEEFIYFLWLHKLLDRDLCTSSGETLEILKPGTRNLHSGPDFFNAKIKIGATLWAGNVEIHIKASDWYKHKHHRDKVYDNIILHVVYLEDKSVRRKSGEIIPTMEIYGKFDQGLLNRYEILNHNRSWIPCQHLIGDVDRFILNSWLDRVLVERLENRYNDIYTRLKMLNSDWAELFYQHLAKNFGFKVNSIPFELLSRSLPSKIIAKHKNELFQLEALFFGQAGLLSANLKSSYFLELKSEYNFLSAKYNLYSIDKNLWKFMRLRPSNFPTIRLSQFASLVHKSNFLFSEILEIESLKELEVKFEVCASSFWDNHYTFVKRSRKMTKSMGIVAIHLLLLNTVIPFLFAYGKINNKSNLINRALSFLDQIQGESNSTISKWQSLGLSVRTAFNTQALMELKKYYCNRKRCLHCGIGSYLLTNRDNR